MPTCGFWDNGRWAVSEELWYRVIWGLLLHWSGVLGFLEVWAVLSLGCC